MSHPDPSSAWGHPAPPAPPRSAVGGPASRTRMLDGVLLAVATAAVAATLWWFLTSLLERQFVYGAIVVGFLVGLGTITGTRRSGLVPALVAAAATVIALAVAEYFIQRSLAVKDGLDIPLWNGFSAGRTIVVESVKDHPLTGAMWAVAAAAAAFTAGSGNRGPVL